MFAVVSERPLSVHFSVCVDGKQQVCEGAVLPVLSRLLQDEDLEVRVNAAGVIMYAVIITPGTNTHFRWTLKLSGLSSCSCSGR